MTNSVVIGAGWHPSLFRLEAAQLIESFEFVHAHALVCDASDAPRLISRSSLISEVLSPGGIVPVDNAIETVAKAFLALNLEGSVALDQVEQERRLRAGQAERLPVKLVVNWLKLEGKLT